MNRKMTTNIRISTTNMRFPKLRNRRYRNKKQIPIIVPRYSESQVQRESVSRILKTLTKEEK